MIFDARSFKSDLDRRRMLSLSSEGGRRLRRVLPVRGEDPPPLVVPREPVDPALDEDEPVLAVDIVVRPLEVLPHVHRLLDEEVELFWEGWGETVRPEDALDLVASDGLDLADAVAVTEERADLGWPDALLRVIADELDAVLSGKLEPVWSCAAVWGGGSGDTFARGVETTHLKGRASPS